MIPRLAAAGHEPVLLDLEPPRKDGGGEDLPFFRCDLQAESGLEAAARGCDAVLHAAAWHGVHMSRRSETEYWRLNVDGTFRLLQTARDMGVTRFIFMSSRARHNRYDKYGFTKAVGEELCEYHRRQHGLRYIAIRPGDFTPWGNDFVGYGRRLLYGGVARDDVLNCIELAVERLARDQLEHEDPEGFAVEAVGGNAFGQEELANWVEDPLAVCERVFPGSAKLLQRYEIDVARKPLFAQADVGARLIGYSPREHFGTFLDQLTKVDAAGGAAAVHAIRCPY